MARPTAASLLATEPELASFAGVAAALNQAYDWPDGRVIDRRQVERWSARGTLNKMGQTPPSPARTRRKVSRTSPRKLYHPDAWVAWAAVGVPGPRNKGWVVPDAVAS